MPIKLIALCTLGLSTLAASTHLADIRTEAARIEREGQAIEQLLKAKQPDKAALQEKLAAAGAGIEKLRELVPRSTTSLLVELARQFVLAI